MHWKLDTHVAIQTKSQQMMMKSVVRLGIASLNSSNCAAHNKAGYFW